MPVPDVLLKRYVRYSLLALTWLPELKSGSRALLIGLGGVREQSVKRQSTVDATVSQQQVNRQCMPIKQPVQKSTE